MSASRASSAALRKSDRTAALRSRRYRANRKQAIRSPGRVNADASVPAPSRPQHRFSVTAAVTLFAALAVAAVPGAFSVIGLTAIFAGAFWPILGMGAALEFGKLSAVAWLGARHAASRALKAVTVTLVVMLMALNAVGTYGFLAHAHLDHAVAGQVAIDAKAADVDARRRVTAGELADTDRRIAQLDSTVSEATRRGRTTAATVLIEQETTRRDGLVAERTREATSLAGLQVEGAAVEGERSKLAADSGPMHYLSVILGIRDDTAVRWFILAVALLLDPLAVALLLASNRPPLN